MSCSGSCNSDRICPSHFQLLSLLKLSSFLPFHYPRQFPLSVSLWRFASRNLLSEVAFLRVVIYFLWKRAITAPVLLNFRHHCRMIAHQTRLTEKILPVSTTSTTPNFREQESKSAVIVIFTKLTHILWILTVPSALLTTAVASETDVSYSEFPPSSVDEKCLTAQYVRRFLFVCSQTMRVRIIDDEEYEKHENFFIVLEEPRWLKRGISGEPRWILLDLLRFTGNPYIKKGKDKT